MTTYTITGASTLRNLGTARTGGDIYNVNGGSLVIDQDTRYGQGGGAAFSLAAMTLSATLGGLIEVDARNVRLVPYTGGSGTITAGSTITCGGATGIVIGLYSAINVAPVLTGVAAGWIKVTGWNGVAFPTAGAFTQAGFTFTLNGADKAGFIELVGDEAATCTVPRLGTFRMRGEWYDVGTTSGSNATTYQLPTNGSVQYFPGVQVETAVGSGIFEWYPCAGSLVAAASTATDAVRGKVCWISTAGVLRLGSDGTNTVGYLPPAGLGIRVPNIITANCTTAARATNALPNATLATRYDFTTTGGGVIDMERANLSWFPSFAQPFSVRLVDVGINEQLLVSKIAAPIEWLRICVGQSAAQAQFALSMTQCLAGGTAVDCVWTRASLAAGGFVHSLTGVYGFTWGNNKLATLTVRTNATNGTMALNNVKDCTWHNPTFGGGRVFGQICTRLKFNNTTYFDTPATTTLTVGAHAAFDFVSGCDGIFIDGMGFGGLENCHPYLSLVSIGQTGCKNIYLRNVGSRSNPLNLGTLNQCNFAVAINGGATAENVRIQRFYVVNTLNGIYSVDNSSKNILIENVSGDYADNPANSALNMTVRAVGCTSQIAAQTGCYGTHWRDEFNSLTVGKIIIAMNEPTPDTTDQVSVSGGAAFTSAGGLYMPAIGHSATFNMPYSALGHTAFANSALVMAGGTVGNYTFAWQADTGSGFGAWSAELTAAALGTALSGLGAINPATGVRLKLRITTSGTNATAITSVYLVTATTAVAQDNQYPLDTNTITFTDLPVGTEVRIRVGSKTLATTQDIPGSTYSYTYAADDSPIKAQFTLPGYVFEDINFTQTAINQSRPVVWSPDPSYIS